MSLLSRPGTVPLHGIVPLHCIVIFPEEEEESVVFVQQYGVQQPSCLLQFQPNAGMFVLYRC
jgi:hypothetical protein